MATVLKEKTEQWRAIKERLSQFKSIGRLLSPSPPPRPPTETNTQLDLLVDLADSPNDENELLTQLPIELETQLPEVQNTVKRAVFELPKVTKKKSHQRGCECCDKVQFLYYTITNAV